MIYNISTSSDFKSYNRFFKQQVQSASLGYHFKTSGYTSSNKVAYLPYFYSTIESFKTLKDGWNGDKAKAIPISVIESALTILKEVPQEGLKVFPTGRESIQFEYDCKERSLEIEIFENEFEITLFDNFDLVSSEKFKINESNKIESYLTGLYKS